MTYWATLYYAGAVVLSMGYEGQTLEQCNFLGQQMMYDITTAYMDPALEEELAERLVEMSQDSDWPSSIYTNPRNGNRFYVPGLCYVGAIDSFGDPVLYRK